MSARSGNLGLHHWNRAKDRGTPKLHAVTFTISMSLSSCQCPYFRLSPILVSAPTHPLLSPYCTGRTLSTDPRNLTPTSIDCGSFVMDSNDDAGAELWRHPSPESTRMWEFMHLIGKKYNLSLDSYDELYQWSIDNIALFWEEAWEFTGIKTSRHYNKVNHSCTITWYVPK